jgi:hypothetical protein
MSTFRLIFCVLFNRVDDLAQTFINHSGESYILYRCLRSFVSLVKSLDCDRGKIAYVNRYITCKHVNHNGGLVHLRLRDQSTMVSSQGFEEVSWYSGTGVPRLLSTHLSHRRRFAQTNTIKAQMYPVTIEPRYGRIRKTSQKVCNRVFLPRLLPQVQVAVIIDANLISRHRVQVTV